LAFTPALRMQPRRNRVNRLRLQPAHFHVLDARDLEELDVGRDGLQRVLDAVDLPALL